MARTLLTWQAPLFGAALLCGCPGPGGSDMMGDPDGGQSILGFTGRMDITVGAEPKALTILDVTGDGRRDVLLVRNVTNGKLVSVQSRTDGSFAANEEATLGSYPYDLVAVDMDGDQKPDALAVNYFDSNASVLWGGSSGGFVTGLTLPTGAHPGALDVADVDGDQRPDVVVASQVAQGLTVTLNGASGGRTFGTRTDYPLGGTPSGLRVGDIDGDGRADAVVALPGRDILRILWGQPGGVYAMDKVLDLDTGAGPLGVGMVKLNGDNTPDLVASNSNSNDVSVLLSTGPTTFGSGVTYPAGTSPAGLAMGDVNGDGIFDIAVANSGSNNVTLLHGQQGGTFTVAGELPAGKRPVAVALGDLNGDGATDIAIANAGGSSVTLYFRKL